MATRFTELSIARTSARCEDRGRRPGTPEIVAAALTEVPRQARLLPDKDLPVLLAALAGRATHFLTVDKKHFGSLFGKTVGQVLILSPGEYLGSACHLE